MDIQTANKYFEAISVLEAQEMLSDLTVSAFPHLKSEERKNIHRSISRKANSGFPKDGLSPQAGAAWIKGKLNG